MTLRHLALGSMLLGSAGLGEAKTYVFYTDPMSLDRRMVVYDTPGRDRVLMCMTPPSESGCTELPARRGR